MKWYVLLYAMAFALAFGLAFALPLGLFFTHSLSASATARCSSISPWMALLILRLDFSAFFSSLSFCCLSIFNCCFLSFKTAMRSLSAGVRATGAAFSCRRNQNTYQTTPKKTHAPTASTPTHLSTQCINSKFTLNNVIPTHATHRPRNRCLKKDRFPFQHEGPPTCVRRRP